MQTAIWIQNVTSYKKNHALLIKILHGIMKLIINDQEPLHSRSMHDRLHNYTLLNMMQVVIISS